ncbi:hypothetical protein NRB_26170 [Novosphingobium sp. 11B]
MLGVTPSTPALEDMAGALGQPAVLASLVAGIVAIVVLAVNSRIAAKLHHSKLAADQAAAKEKFEFDKSLAERKFELDRDLNNWKRSSDFAETALREFYEARSVMIEIRSPGSFSDENSDRIGRDKERQEERDLRDTYYPYLRRMHENQNFFNNLYSKRYRAAALFGVAAMQPFNDIHAAMVKVGVAAMMLGAQKYDQFDNSLRDKLELDIWLNSHANDEILKKFDRAINEAENIFRPAITGYPSATNQEEPAGRI